ncbi:MFS transporter [Nocardia sp. NBC_01327]|uniref:MFS transporter n=1 Tax=Nocardia sp. NBC_01327 TaxID=2903593 RepID=UPI002E146E75|nr:MFS transporter [Nocardia sp. NBC_01327]
MSSSIVLRNRDFRLLWSGNAASQIGLQGAQLAYPLLALILTGSPISASLVGFAIALPSLIFEIPAGIAADHWDRRLILMTCQRVGLVATLLAATVISTRPPGLPLLLAVAAFAEGTANVFFDTSELVLVRDVVTEKERTAAFSFLEAEQPIANFVGRTLGAATFGIARGLPFLANAGSYLYCLWTLSKIQTRVPVKPEVAGSKPARMWDWNEARVGMASLRAEPFAWGATTVLGATNAMFQVFIFLITLEVREGGHPAWTVGVVLGATGLGGLLGAVPAAKLAGRINPRSTLTGMLWVWSVLTVPIVLSSNPAVLAVCWMGVGFAAPIGNIPLILYRVRVFPQDLIGRIFGATKLITNGGTALGALLAGSLLSMLGIHTVGWALVAGMVLLARRARRLPDPLPRTLSLSPSALRTPATWITRLAQNGLDEPR